MKKLAAIFISAFLPLAAKAQDLGGSLLSQAAGPNGAGYRSGVTVEAIVGTVISVLLGILGVIFLILIVLGGYWWMIAGGDESKIEKSRNTMTRAIIGLAIVLAAYAITYYVVNAITEKTLR